MAHRRQPASVLATEVVAEPPRKSLAGDQDLHLLSNSCYRDAFLLHGVPVADGDPLVFEGVEVYRNAERRPHLVLAAVAAADGAGVVVGDAVVALEVIVELPGDLCDGLLLCQWEDGGLYGGEAGVKPQDRACFAAYLFLVVGVYEKGECDPIGAGSGLDDVRDVRFARGLVEIRQVFAGMSRVLFEVVVGAVGYPFKLRPAAKREAVLDIYAPARVVGTFLRGLLPPAEVLGV